MAITDLPLAERLKIAESEEYKAQKALSKFEELKFGRFPVLERESGKLVGILTKGDVIRCLLNKIHVNYQKEEIHTYRASHIFEDTNSDGTTLILNFTVVAGGNYRLAGKQCSHLKRNLLRLGLDPKLVRRITVATCEAEMNIIVFTKGGELIVRMIDEIPGVCALAAVSKGRTEVRDATELRVKESDRIATMAHVLGAFGVPCEELPDGMIITGGAPLHGARIDSRGDHRIAMSAALLGLLAEGESQIDGAEAVDTSFPGFVALLRSLGADITEETL